MSKIIITDILNEVTSTLESKPTNFPPLS